MRVKKLTKRELVQTYGVSANIAKPGWYVLEGSLGGGEVPFLGPHARKREATEAMVFEYRGRQR